MVLNSGSCLGHLWRYGGIFYFPSYREYREKQKIIDEIFPCILLEKNVKSFDSNIEKGLPAGANIVKEKINKFVFTMRQWNAANLPSSLNGNVWNAYSRHCNLYKRWCLIRNPKSLKDLYHKKGMPISDEDQHFGILSLDSSVTFLNHGNIGDEMQTLSGIQFFPFLDFFYDRDMPIAPNVVGESIVFFNAWWGRRNRKWPPPSNINSIMLSVHVNSVFQNFITQSPDTIAFLKSKEPIGARDTKTKKFLETLGVRSFFSGCMTLFLRRPVALNKRNEIIYIVDVKREGYDVLPKWVQQSAKFVRHNVDFGKNETLMTKRRHLLAYQLLEKYSNAKIVITQRIHAALSCVALGTPVIFFDGNNMPGGGGKGNKSSDRLAGLTEMFHLIDLHKLTQEEAKENLHSLTGLTRPEIQILALV